MPVNTEKQRTGIGTFYCQIAFFSNEKACDPITIFKCFLKFLYNSFLSIILVLKVGDIELNPGPNKSHIHISLVAIEM